MHVTDHAKKRIRKRFGIPSKAVDRFAQMAFTEGVLAQEVDERWRMRQEQDLTKLLVYYQNGVFVFGLHTGGKVPVLLTVINLDKAE